MFVGNSGCFSLREQQSKDSREQPSGGASIIMAADEAGVSRIGGADSRSGPMYFSSSSSGCAGEGAHGLSFSKLLLRGSLSWCGKRSPSSSYPRGISNGSCKVFDETQKPGLQTSGVGLR